MTAAYPDIAAVSINEDNQTFLCLVDPSRNSTFEFLSNVWTAVTDVFPDSAIAIGCGLFLTQSLLALLWPLLFDVM